MLRQSLYIHRVRFSERMLATPGFSRETQFHASGTASPVRTPSTPISPVTPRPPPTLRKGAGFFARTDAPAAPAASTVMQHHSMHSSLEGAAGGSQQNFMSTGQTMPLREDRTPALWDENHTSSKSIRLLLNQSYLYALKLSVQRTLLHGVL